MLMDIPFSNSEMRCNCGCGFVMWNERFMQKLLAARFYADIEFKINSWCRCIDHNRAEGGSDTSSHLNGQAVDIECISIANRYQVIKALIKVGFERIIIHPDFIHVDQDPVKFKPMIMIEP